MLAYLSIKNFALIEDLEVNFDKGLTTITGETGAGKSIILTAVSLLTGSRADLSMVRDASKKCIIEAEFKLSGLELQDLFSKYDFDYKETTIIRREFNREGKSRVFVNDSPAVLLHLKEIVDHLLDVHSQHENLQLNKRKYQLDSVDIYAGNLSLIKKYNTEFYLYKTAEKELSELQDKSMKMRENADFISFQLNELKDAGLQLEEQEELEEEIDTLIHAEEIKTNLHQVMQVLNKQDGNIIDELNEISSLIKKTTNHLGELKEVDGRLESLIIELEDIRRDIDHISDSTSYDPDRISIVQDRLSLIYQLEQKHRVNTIQELIDIMDKLDLEFEQISNIDDLIEDASQNLAQIKKSVSDMATELSNKRTIAAAEFGEKVLDKMKRLGMDKTVFNISVEDTGEPALDGKDVVEFLFSANQGITVKPIAKVASGGELSRLMLSIKASLAERSELASIIFDEIDTGISGEVADKMGRIILEMGDNTQIIAITHLPQIAAKGARQLKVYKEEKNGTTVTRIKALNSNERIEEIARLLSGHGVSKEALENARVLLRAL